MERRSTKSFIRYFLGGFALGAIGLAATQSVQAAPIQVHAPMVIQTAN